MLECPICHSTPTPKVFIHQCTNGHVLCQKCRHPNQTICSQCQEPFNFQSSNRNLFCEKILDLLPLECSFLEHGCEASEIENAEDLLVHEKKCPHRLIRCIYPLCQALLPLHNFPNHMLDTSHFLNAVTPCSGVIDKSEVHSSITRIGSIMDSRTCWKVTHIYIDGKYSLGRKHFFTELIQVSPGSDSDWVFWVYMLGSEKEAIEYEYKLIIQSASDPLLDHQFDEGLCVSVDKPVEAMLKDASNPSLSNSKAFHIIPPQLLSNFINPSDGSLSILVDIKKTSHKLPLAISIPDVINLSDYLTPKKLSNGKHLNHVIQADEYASQMLHNVSQKYKQIDKICSISGQATGFEKGPYSRSRQTQNKIIKRQKEKSKFS